MWWAPTLVLVVGYGVVGTLSIVLWDGYGFGFLCYSFAVMACLYRLESRREFRRGWRTGMVETASSFRTATLEMPPMVLRGMTHPEGDATPEPWDDVLTGDVIVVRRSDLDESE